MVHKQFEILEFGSWYVSVYCGFGTDSSAERPAEEVTRAEGDTGDELTLLRRAGD